MSSEYGWTKQHACYDPYMLNILFGDKLKSPDEPEEIIERPKIHIDYSKLNSKHKKIIELYLRGKNFTQAGIVLGISRQAANKLFKHAIKRLKETNGNTHYYGRE